MMLLKSTTSDASLTPIQFVKGVGPGLGALFNKRGISTVRDILYFFPRTYEDRSKIGSISTLKDGDKVSLIVQVVSQRQIPISKLKRSILEVRCRDGSGELLLKWFYPPRGLEKRLISGVQIVVTGKVKQYGSRPEIIHPEISWDIPQLDHTELWEPVADVGRIIPIYVEIEGIPSRTLRRVLWAAIEKFGVVLEEDLPAYLLERRKLPTLSEAVRSLHFPPKEDLFELEKLAQIQTPAHLRIIYGELFQFEYMMLRRKLNIDRTISFCFGKNGGSQKVEFLKQMLPFNLTQGQEKALGEILIDLKQDHPMHRLVQGDVGAGKTAVALLSIGCVLAEGGQVALMAPTEILAEQHYKSALELFKNELPVCLLMGKTSVADRKILYQRLQSGEALLVIGTHALLEDTIIFSHLVYILVDEQHRFGVEQRKVLREKGSKVNIKGQLMQPHSLVLTATPIPRTLALTAYGDLDVSLIQDLPPGRSRVCTEVVRTIAKKKHVYEKIHKEIQAGRQAYFIYPLIHESEAEGWTQLKSAIKEAQILASEIFPEYSVSLLHGQLNSEEKSTVMAQFKQGVTQILVSTTVIEVGVDVPNSTIMVIEHAERFGLSQLHQLRGRVGRGRHQSYCYLISDQQLKQDISSRLEILEECHDGFQIAEADLALRGPGEFLGVRQAGSLPFRIADLVRDREWVLKAREDALEIMRKDPDLLDPMHAVLKSYYEREGGCQLSRLSTG